MLDIYLTNLGKYNEGELVGEWVRLPMKSSDFAQALERIGIDNSQYEEYFISDVDCDISGVYETIGEYSNIKEINFLALRMKELDTGELKKLEAMIDYEGCSSLASVINLTYSMDAYAIYEDVTNEREYGEMIAREGFLGEIPENLEPYLDHEAIGRDYILGGYSTSITDYGLIEKVDEVSAYTNEKDLPTREEMDEAIDELENTELER